MSWRERGRKELRHVSRSNVIFFHFCQLLFSFYRSHCVRICTCILKFEFHHFDLNMHVDVYATCLAELNDFLRNRSRTP